MAANFIKDLDAKTWQATLANYEKVLLRKAEQKTKKESRDELIRLDKWYQETLPHQITSRPEKYIKSEELVDLVKWKLSRGKFRPRLVDFAKSNPAEEVESLSKLAFKSVEGSKGGKANGLSKAIDILAKLKGIGPATASAVLAVGCPDEAPFMADEPTMDVLQASKLKYTKQEYVQYADGILRIRDKLREDDPSFGWTAHKVELALWTNNVGSGLGVDLSAPVPAANGKEDHAVHSGESVTSEKSSPKKRKTTSSKSENSSGKKSEEEPSKKKKKR